MRLILGNAITSSNKFFKKHLFIYLFIMIIILLWYLMNTHQVL